MFTIADILFPKRCVNCRTLGSYLCSHCIIKIERVRIPLCLECDRPAVGGAVHPGCRKRFGADGISPIFLFKSPIKQLLHEVKYRGVSDAVSLCTILMEPHIPSAIWQTRPIVVPVPLYPTKERERGFNQSALLASRLSQLHSVEMNPRILRRTRPTQSQTTLDKFNRRRNVLKAFTCTARLDKKNVIIIDDTVTTGATINACAKALKMAGANFVWAITVAQAPLGRQQMTQDW